MRRAERGSTIPLIIGFAAVLLVAVAVVVDVTAAYLHRQSLDSLADGAALQGADLGAEGAEVYAGGLAGRRLELTRGRAHAAVADYLLGVGAYERFPGLRFDVDVDPAAERVSVRLQAPLELPLTVPGAPDTALVGATGAAVVSVEAPE